MQQFQTPQGIYLFNHLTGQQTYSSGNPAPAVPSVPSSLLSAPPSLVPGVPTPVQPPVVQKRTPVSPRTPVREEDPLQLADPWASGPSKGPPVKAVPVKAAPAVLKAAPAHPKPPGLALPSSPTPIVHSDAAPQPSLSELTEAMNGWYSWKSFMEPCAQRLEAALRARQTFTCLLCDCNVDRASEHLPAYEHWYKVWEKLGCSHARRLRMEPALGADLQHR